MYLKKENNTIIASNLGDLINRHFRQIMLITKGYKKEELIIFDFEEKKINNLLHFLDDNNIKYSLSDSLVIVLENKKKHEEEFNKNKKMALQIKNNYKGNSELYLDFINVIKNNLTRRLYDHQLRSAFHMAFAINSCNFSVPGSGKTTIVYAAYSYLKSKKIVDKLFVVGPLSSYMAWKDEFFDCFNYKANIIDLSKLNKIDKKEYFNRYAEIQSEITFINYEGFNGIKKDLVSFIEKNKVMIVLDEAHKIKNPDAKRSINIMSFSNKAKSRIILTGTPIPNGYKDLYNLFEFIWPKQNVIGFNQNQLQIMSSNSIYKEQILSMMDNINPFYIRITKKELNLPKPIFNVPIKVKMGVVQQKIYNFIAEDFITNESYDIDDELRGELKKAKLIRLMQTITNPASIAKSLKSTLHKEVGIYKYIVNYNDYETPSKYLEVLRIIEEIIKKNQKVIIWTQFTYNIKSLQTFLISQNIVVKTLFGEIENSERENIIVEFHNNDLLKVLIANPAAVAESISLHKTCHNAIYLDKSFNAAHYMQSKDRIHRVGLKPTDEINYFFLLSENTIDEVIHDRVLLKEQNMINVIEGREVPLFSEYFDSDFTDEDIIAIKEYLSKEKK